MDTKQTAKELSKEISRHAKVMQGVLAKLKAHILTLPANPRITDSPRCFTMSFSDVGKDLSVEHHDFKKQYELVVRELETCQPDDILNRLKEMLSEGRIRPNSNISHRVMLHPDVNDHLCMAAGLVWTSVAEWPEGTCDAIGNRSTDTHSTRSAAEAVCRRLRMEGFGGDGIKFPVRTHVEIVIP
jgi:hypothetical protein